MKKEIMYTLFSENNENEGEKWLIFVKQGNNSSFIQKMLEGIDVQNNEDGDSCIKFCDQNIPKSEIDVLKKYNKYLPNGYFNIINIVDKDCNPNNIQIDNADDFNNSTYKLQCYNLD